MLPSETAQNYRKAFVLLLLIGVLAAFLAMIREFLIAILLAIIFTALLYPVYVRVLKLCRGYRAPSAVIVIVLAILLVGLPVLGFLGIVAAEAVEISKSVAPWIEKRLPLQSELSRGFPNLSEGFPEWLPFAEQLEPYRTRIIAKLGEFAGNIGQFLARSISKVTQGTISFLINFFIMLYAMFFFLIWGPDSLTPLMRYLPLSEEDLSHILNKGLSVTRAVLKSMLVIGALQGVLVGLAFWAAGINGSAFWGTLVVVFSAIPGLGAPVIWIPGVIYLAFSGQTGWAIGLTLWGVIVVGMVDNILRPRIVGSEAKMSDLLILLAILGGIMMFGAIGIIIGPIIAALLVTMLDIYEKIFSDLYPRSE